MANFEEASDYIILVSANVTVYYPVPIISDEMVIESQNKMKTNSIVHGVTIGPSEY